MNNQKHLFSKETPKVSHPNGLYKNVNDPSVLYQLQQQQHQQTMHQAASNTSQVASHQLSGSYCTCRDCFQSPSHLLNAKQPINTANNYYQSMQQQHQQQMLANAKFQNYTNQGNQMLNQNSNLEPSKHLNASSHVSKSAESHLMSETYHSKVPKTNSAPVTTLTTSFQNSLAQNNFSKPKASGYNNDAHLMNSEYSDLFSNGLQIKKLKNDFYPTMEQTYTGHSTKHDMSHLREQHLSQFNVETQKQSASMCHLKF